MTVGEFRLLTRGLSNETEIIINYDDTHLNETVEFSADTLK